MERIKTFTNLKKIIVKSYEWRHRNLSSSSNEKIKFKIYTVFNWIVFIVATLISLFVNAISDDLVNAILTFTSIFATLIIPVLILVYDKFSRDPNRHLKELEKKSEGASRRYKLHKAFTNRYIFVTLENIILSVFIILLILIYKSFFVCYLQVNHFNFTIDFDFAIESYKVFFYLLCVLTLKVVFSMLLIKFVYFLFFSIGAIGDFFISVLEEKD